MEEKRYRRDHAPVQFHTDSGHDSLAASLPVAPHSRACLEGSGKDGRRDALDTRVFFDIAYKPSPFLKAVAKLPIFGDKAELAQYDAPHLIAEIDITETPAELAQHLAQRFAASTPAPEKAESVPGSAKK
jgi:hypothetical protein